MKDPMSLELRSGEDCLQSYMDSLPDGILIVDAACRPLFWNSQAMTIWGRPLQGHFTLWPLILGLHDETGGRLLRMVDLPFVRSLQGETVEEFPIFLKNADAPRGRRVLCTSRPLYHDGKIVAAIILFREISLRTSAPAP